MKTFIRIIVCTLVAIIIQQGIFMYVENVYLDTNAEITVEKVDENVEEETSKKEEVQLSANVGDISLSDDGRYIAYLQDDKLKVLDSNDGTEEMEDLEDDIQVIENDDEQLPEKKGKWSIVLLSLPLIAAAVWLFCFNRIKKKRKMKKMRLF